MVEYRRLARQAAETALALRAVEEFLRGPTAAAAARVLRRRDAARLKAQEVRRRASAGVFAASAALEDLVDFGQAGVEEAVRFEARADEGLGAAAAALAAAAAELAGSARVLASDRAACAERLLRARRLAKAAQQDARRGAIAASRRPNAVEAMKTRTAARRFSDAAGAADKAAEAIGDLLVGGE